MSTDPVYEKEGGWYYKDESFTFEYGPYGSKEEATTALFNYLKFLKDGLFASERK